MTSDDRVRPNTGSYSSETAALQGILDRLVKALDPEAIWLFGSRARGTHRPDSDFDLLVVTKLEDGDSGHDYDRVYAPLIGSGVGCDVVPIRIDDFQQETGSATGLIREILQSGTSLYEKRTSKA